jgi:hypothetical protein
MGGGKREITVGARVATCVEPEIAGRQKNEIGVPVNSSTGLAVSTVLSLWLGGKRGYTQAPLLEVGAWALYRMLR